MDAIAKGRRPRAPITIRKPPPNATKRQKQRQKHFPEDKDVKRLADLLGCHPRTVYRFEEAGNEHLPRNAVIRTAYEDLIKNGPPKTLLGEISKRHSIMAQDGMQQVRKAFAKVNLR